MDHKVSAEALRAAMSTAEAADYLATTPGYLRELRSNGTRTGRMMSPPYVRLSSRKVVYLREDLDAWLARHRVDPAAATETIEEAAA